MAETAHRPSVCDVEVVVEDARWTGIGLPMLAERACAAALAYLDLGSGWQITVLGCDDSRISALNADFRGRPVPTNVLSWPAAERVPAAGGRPPAPPDPADPELGDIAIAWETCETEARAGGIPVAQHATHLLVHATLHLLGYDHISEADGDLMEALETAILAQMGLPDPYVVSGA